MKKLSLAVEPGQCHLFTWCCEIKAIESVIHNQTYNLFSNQARSLFPPTNFFSPLEKYVEHS